MKVSKLFHWLYAFLMLLPCFAIISVVLVNTFNKQVETPSQEVTINYKYETNEVSSVDDLIIGNIYNIKIEDIGTTEINTNYLHLVNVYDADLEVYDIELFGNDYITLYANDETRTIFILDFDTYGIFHFTFDDLSLVDLVFIDRGGDLDYSSYSKCENIPIESVDIVEVGQDTENVFYRSLDKVANSPYFNWAYHSFLVAPFTYIVALFGMPIDSPIVMLLSYWLDIALIWLVFDLVMYVPQLVHRWIDKGMVE